MRCSASPAVCPGIMPRTQTDRCAAWRAAGLCATCGRRPPTTGSPRCDACRAAAMAAYYRRTGSRRGERGQRGRKPATDWASVDWSQSTSTLAAALGVTRQAVNQQRLIHAPHTARPVGGARKYQPQPGRSLQAVGAAARRAAWRAAGLCAACGRRPPTTGSPRCDACRAVDRAAYHRRTAS